MKQIEELSRKELAAFIAEHLRKNNIDVVFTGGLVSLFIQMSYMFRKI